MTRKQEHQIVTAGLIMFGLLLLACTIFLYTTPVPERGTYEVKRYNKYGQFEGTDTVKKVYKQSH